MGTKKCCECGQIIGKRDEFCGFCNSQQLKRRGMFGWWLLGAIAGWVIPAIFCIILVCVVTDRYVRDEVLNPTIKGRSRWRAMRVGIICGLITQAIVYLLLMLGMVWSAWFISNGLGC